VSNFSTYLIGALAAALVIDHAPTPAPLRPVFELFEPTGEFIRPAIAVDRTLKGDRRVPEHVQRDARPANAPLGSADAPTGTIGETHSPVLPSGPAVSNVTRMGKKAAPEREQKPGKRGLPLGCESAFGRLAAPPLAQVASRCII
jgi:hypothetical protein